MIIVSVLASLVTLATIFFCVLAWIMYSSGNYIALTIVSIAIFVFAYVAFAFWYGAYRIYRDY